MSSIWRTASLMSADSDDSTTGGMSEQGKPFVVIPMLLKSLRLLRRHAPRNESRLTGGISS